jgi:GT2 family glycosyltransferase
MSSSDLSPPPPIGVVAIGRNEGERLGRCLASAVGAARAVVYVDSGSTDGSPAAARATGADVVDLDLSVPFTAARARNAGFARLAEVDPSVEFVQFVDGDCEIVAGWLDRAAAELAADERLAVVCGRRRERHPEASAYNRLCDLEWDTPVGPAKACGGDAMVRAAAFRQVGGYDAAVIAGEEPEMCVRLRAAGWTVLRLDAEMTLHDAAMTRFGQWWTRNVRAGHAYAEGTAMHGRPPERHGVRAVRSNWVWGLAVPVAVAALLAIGFVAWPAWVLAGALLLGYPLIGWRIYRGQRRRGRAPRDARLYATFVVLGKVPQAIGQWKYRRNRMAGRRSGLIEYKGTAGPTAASVPATR